MRSAWIRAAAATAALLLTVSLAGCATSTAGTSLMSARDEVPTSSIRPYLPVEDVPQNHPTLMTADEQSKIKNELIAVRAHQEAAVKASQHQ
jgi:hypothetical protein